MNTSTNVVILRSTKAFVWRPKRLSGVLVLTSCRRVCVCVCVCRGGGRGLVVRRVDDGD